MPKQTVSKAVSLALSAVMMLVTLAAIDQLAVREPQARQMAAAPATTARLARTTAPATAPRLTPAARS